MMREPVLGGRGNIAASWTQELIVQARLDYFDRPRRRRVPAMNPPLSLAYDFAQPTNFER